MKTLQECQNLALELHRVYTPPQAIVSKLNELSEDTFYLAYGNIYRINPASPVADLILNKDQKEIYD